MAKDFDIFVGKLVNWHLIIIFFITIRWTTFKTVQKPFFFVCRFWKELTRSSRTTSHRLDQQAKNTTVCIVFPFLEECIPSAYGVSMQVQHLRNAKNFTCGFRQNYRLIKRQEMNNFSFCALTFFETFRLSPNIIESRSWWWPFFWHFHSLSEVQLSQLRLPQKIYWRKFI